MVRYREIRPSARLRPFVHTFWILEHEGADTAAQRVVPDGHAELILNWGQPFEACQENAWRRQPRCFFAGQIEGPLLLRPAGRTRTFGVRFQPEGAARVFRQPMHEFRGRFTPVDDLSARLARELDKAPESQDPIGAVETALWAAHENLPGDALIEGAVRRIASQKGATDLGRLSGELGIGLRQLERRFQAAVGLTPKVFCRIRRFNKVFHLLDEPSHRWADTALACGYYDQAHLIRDCQNLTGTSPARLWADGADLARHFYERFGVSRSYKTALPAPE